MGFEIIESFWYFHSELQVREQQYSLVVRASSICIAHEKRKSLIRIVILRILPRI